MKHLLALTIAVLLVCAGCGNGGPTGIAIPIAIPTNLEGFWTFKIGFGCESVLRGGFLDPNDGDEIYFVDQSGLRLTADFNDSVGNRVVMSATIDGPCVEGTYTITERLVTPTVRQSICDTKAYTSSGTSILTGGVFGQVQVIDLATNQETDVIDFGTPPGRLCGTPDGTLVFVPLPGNGTVAVIDTTTDTVVDTIVGDTGEMPSPFCCVATNDTLYVGNDLQIDSGGVVTVIDIASRSVVNTIFTLGFDATDMVLTPDGSQLLVAYSDTTTIESFSTATLTATGNNFVIGFEPNSMDISPNGQHLVVVGDTQTMVCATLQGDQIGVIEEGGHDVRVTSDSSAFWFTHLPNQGAVLGGITEQYRTISGYNLPSLNPIRTYFSTNNIPAFGIDLCDNFALTGFSSSRPTIAWDLLSTNQFGSEVGSFSPSEFVYILPRRVVIPPARVFTFGFKFWIAFDNQTGLPMADGDVVNQTQSFVPCFASTWTLIDTDVER